MSRISITRDQGRKFYNYLKSITGRKGKSSHELNSVEDCKIAILQLIFQCSNNKTQRELLRENEFLKIRLEIEKEENDSLYDEITFLTRENRKLKKY